MTTTYSADYRTAFQDWLNKALESVVTLPDTRQGLKSLSMDLAQKWYVYAKTTHTGLDDIFASRLVNMLDTHFDQWYAMLCSAVGLKVENVPEFGASDFAFAGVEYDIPTEQELVAFASSQHDAQVVMDAAREFGISADQVILFIDWVLPVLIQWIRNRAS